MPALDGMRILDMTQYEAGTSCTQALAWFGADVVKLERPGVGDLARSQGPFAGDDPHPEKSLFFLILNLNKLGATLRIETVGGKKLFRQLVRDADVVVAKAVRPIRIAVESDPRMPGVPSTKGTLSG